MSGVSTAEVQRVVVEVLAPYIGANMASSSARMFIAKLGALEVIGPKEAEQLVAWMVPGLKVFVGDARTKDVTAQLKKALAALVDGGER